MQPYRALSAARMLTLTALSFQAGASNMQPGQLTDVATLRTAIGHMTILTANKPARLYIMARIEQGAAAGSTTPVNFTVNTGGRVLTRTPRAGRAFPTLAHPDVRAFVQSGSGAWTPARVLDCDFSTGIVNVEKAAGVTKARLYYTFGDGEIKLRASRPYGSSTGSVQLYSSAARSLHENNQADASSSPMLAYRDLPLPPDFILSISVQAYSTVFFDGLAPHEIVIPAADVAIEVLDAGQLAEMGERQLKGGS